MKHLARRKVVFVIVEGPSDETALGIVLNQVFDRESVHVHIMHGDITTRVGVNSQNIVAKVGNEVKAYATSNHYKPADFKQIIHIVDTDAAYLADNKVIEDTEIFQSHYEKAKALEAFDRKEHSDEMLQYYLEACYTYTGEFLSSYIGEAWVSQEAKKYQEMFAECVNKTAEQLRRRNACCVRIFRNFRRNFYGKTRVMWPIFTVRFQK